MKIFCFIKWTKGNLYGVLCTYGNRQNADEMRLHFGKKGCEVSAIATIDEGLMARLNDAKFKEKA